MNDGRWQPGGRGELQGHAAAGIWQEALRSGYGRL